jgi:hypothetical protein
VLKRMLQVAWFTNNLTYELFAYELIGKQHYYLNDLRKASYYLDRTLRGKFELKLSKVREFSNMHYKLKLQQRAERGQLGSQGAIDPENASHNDRVQNCIDQTVEQIYKIQKRSKEGYYKIRHVAAEINLLMTKAALQRKA